MTGFEPGPSDIGSNCSANCATTTAEKIFFKALFYFQPQWVGQDNEQGPLLMKPLSATEVSDRAATVGEDPNSGEHSEHHSPGWSCRYYDKVFIWIKYLSSIILSLQTYSSLNSSLVRKIFWTGIRNFWWGLFFDNNYPISFKKSPIIVYISSMSIYIYFFVSVHSSAPPVPTFQLQPAPLSSLPPSLPPVSSMSQSANSGDYFSNIQPKSSNAPLQKMPPG